MYYVSSFLCEDLPNAPISNFVSRPCQYAFGGKSIQIVAINESLTTTEVATAWQDWRKHHFCSAIWKTACIISLLIPSIILTFCLKIFYFIHIKTQSIKENIYTNRDSDDNASLQSDFEKELLLQIRLDDVIRQNEITRKTHSDNFDLLTEREKKKLDKLTQQEDQVHAENTTSNEQKRDKLKKLSEALNQIEFK